MKYIQLKIQAVKNLRYLIVSVSVFLFVVVFLMMGATQSHALRIEGIKVGLIPTESGVNDLSFNWMAYQGLLQAETDFGVVGTVYTPTGTEDYANQHQQCVNDGNVLCISVGFGFMDVTTGFAQNNPGVNFAIVDVIYETYPVNLRGINFDSSQAGYLAGTLAGLLTESDVIGGIGGMDIDPVNAFLLPYGYGASCVNTQINIIIDYIWSFSDEELANQIAEDQMAAGADVIFPAAGPAGNAALLTATQAGAWGIGVDSDQWLTLFESGSVDGSEYLLTSAMKRVDNAVYATIEDQVSDTFTSGTVTYDLANDGVGLAPYHDADASIPQPVKDQILSIKQDILDGKIDVWQPCYKLNFLPLIIK